MSCFWFSGRVQFIKTYNAICGGVDNLHVRQCRHRLIVDVTWVPRVVASVQVNYAWTVSQLLPELQVQCVLMMCDDDNDDLEDRRRLFVILFLWVLYVSILFAEKYLV